MRIHGEEVCPGVRSCESTIDFVTVYADFLGKGHLKAKTQQDCGASDQALAFADASRYINNHMKSFRDSEHIHPCCRLGVVKTLVSPIGK